tara:strand:+ start:51 stop:1640 length:1590 start_codon:yes stop_codon:yes gene_type:complete
MNTRGTPGGQAPGAGRAVYRMSREQAISEVLGRLDQPALSDQRKLEVPLGWEQRNSRRGWRKDAIELRLKSLRILLHPDKSTPSKRDRFTEALQELMACGDRILGVSSQKQVHTPEPPSPVSSDFATPPPMTPPSAKKRREKARKLRDQLLNEDKTDKERMRAPPNTVSAGLRWSVASIEQRYEAIGAFLRGNIPAGKSADPFWADAFTALEAVRERLLAEAAAGRAPRAPPSPGPPADPNAVAAQHQGDGEMLVFWMSGTHTPTAHHGKKIKDEPSRHASVGRFIDWVGPVLAAGEGQWVATGPKTWSYSRERGQGVGHNHGQSLTGVLAVSAEAAEATLKAVCHLFSTGDSTFFIQHRIHDKGDNRDIGVAFGYTLKDGGGGVQPRRHHYKNCNNFGEVEAAHAAAHAAHASPPPHPALPPSVASRRSGKAPSLAEKRAATRLTLHVVLPPPHTLPRTPRQQAHASLLLAPAVRWTGSTPSRTRSTPSGSPRRTPVAGPSRRPASTGRATAPAPRRSYGRSRPSSPR